MATARKAHCKKSIIVDGNGKASGALFAFTNGRELRCPLTDLDSDVITWLASHGIRQKVGDDYNTADSAEEAYTIASATWNRLVNGQVRAEREGFGGINLDDLARAIAELKGVSIERARQAVEAADESKRKETAAATRIKALMSKYRTERLEKAAEGEGGDLSIEV